jgi:hypothetical protein
VRDPKTVLSEIAAAESPDAYLQSLHPKHEQFQRLRQALLKARGSGDAGGKSGRNVVEIERIINMERWRWMPEDLGRLHVWSNSPEFVLYVVKDGKTIYSDKILVGAIGYATPVFSADMETIVFNPDWIAPETVLVENLLPPLRKKDYSILRNNNLKVSYNGDPVDVRKVDWRRVDIHDYTFTQAAGPKNVLGKVKFLLPNKHVVYMHDTLPVRRKFFQQSVRAIGHNCVRMEKPQHFTEVLLAEDKGWPASQVKDLWDKSVNSPVALDHKIPVHMTYFTAVVDGTGKVATFADLYGLDNKMATALFGNASGFPLPPPESPGPQAEVADGSSLVKRTSARIAGSGSDKYVPISWAEAFAEIGAKVRELAPESVVFYSSGRTSLEASYMYQLLARMYGNNNMPDSSNMCHESTSVALPQTIGVAVGTVKIEDFSHTDCVLFFGQNVGVNSPRMLHQLKEVRDRGMPIITFNPLREAGLVSFTDPQSPLQMLTLSETQISTQYHQLNPGCDLAALVGMAKTLLAMDEEAKAAGGERVIDVDFIAQHTSGFADFVASMGQFQWPDLEACSGLSRAAIEAAAKTYGDAKAVIACYGMGLTQHRSGVIAIQMLSNLLLMRGNIGKPGAGIFPVRGHSNVQGQRTVGITEKPELVPLDRLAQQYSFNPPRERGLDTVGTCEAVHDGSVKAFISLGGNLSALFPRLTSWSVRGGSWK